jgi:hypothetical protein
LSLAATEMGVRALHAIHTGSLVVTTNASPLGRPSPNTVYGSERSKMPRTDRAVGADGMKHMPPAKDPGF